MGNVAGTLYGVSVSFSTMAMGLSARQAIPKQQCHLSLQVEIDPASSFADVSRLSEAAPAVPHALQAAEAAEAAKLQQAKAAALEQKQVQMEQLEHLKQRILEERYAHLIVYILHQQCVLGCPRSHRRLAQQVHGCQLASPLARSPATLCGRLLLQLHKARLRFHSVAWQASCSKPAGSRG